MTSAQLDRISRTGQIDLIVDCLYILKACFQFVDPVLGGLLQLIQVFTNLPFLICRYVSEIIHQRRDLTFLAEILDAQSF